MTAIEALRTRQRQLDQDGVEVGVSRQALDETLDHIEKLETHLRERPYRDGATRIAELEAALTRICDAARTENDWLARFVVDECLKAIKEK